MNKIGVENKKYVAVDGGGSKTEFVLFDGRGTLLSREILGGSNPNIVGIDKSFGILKSGIEKLLKNGEISAVYCGVSGFLSGNNGKKIEKLLSDEFKNVKIDCSGDMLNVLSSAVDCEKGTAVICGTGSVVFAIDGDVVHRVGGWGYLFDKAGSGYDMGRDAVSATLAEEDGSGEKTLIGELVREKLGSDAWSGLGYLYSQSRAYIASFSKIVINAYNRGDGVAEKIITENMRELANRINCASEKYDCGDILVISGGMMNEKAVLLPVIKKYLKKPFEIIVPDLPQIFGACVTCCRKNNVKIYDFKSKFTEQYKEYSDA